MKKTLTLLCALLLLGVSLSEAATVIKPKSSGGGGSGLTSLEGQTGSTQTFTDDTNVTIVSGADAHVITWAGVLAVARGGTGLSSYTAGDLIYATGATTLAKFAKCANGELITWSAGSMVCGTVDTSATTFTFTNKTIDAEATGNVITLPFENWYDVAGCNNATAGPVFNLPTSNAAVPACDPANTNTNKGYLGYNDSTDQAMNFGFRLPAGFTGAIDFTLRWKAAATSGAVGWCVQLIRVPVAATSDPALPAQAAGNCVSDTANGTTLQENEATISGVTCTSCAAGDMIYGSISRDANGGAVTDGMTGDAFLIGFSRTIRRAM